MPRKTLPTVASITPETLQAASHGRPALPPAEQVGPEFVGKTPEHIAEVERTVNGAMVAYTEERDLVNQLIGQTQMAESYAKFSVTVTTSKLAYIKETKIYRALQGVKSGDVTSSGTWEDFCDLIGRSREQVDEDIRNLKALGAEALESMSRIGIGYRELRQYRRLPEDEKVALIEVAKTGDKEAFAELAETIIAKHAQEKSALQKQVDESKADYEALDKNLARHKERADQAERDLDKLKHRVETESPDEYAAQVREEASVAAFAAEAALMGKLRPAFEALEKHDQEHDCTHENFMSGLLAQVEGAILHLRDRYNIKLRPDPDERPDWTREDFDADAVVAAALAKSRQEIGHA